MKKKSKATNEQDSREISIKILDQSLLSDLMLLEARFHKRKLVVQGKDLEKTNHCLEIIQSLKTTNVIHIFSIIRLLGQMEENNLYKKFLKTSNKSLEKYGVQIYDIGSALMCGPIGMVA